MALTELITSTSPMMSAASMTKKVNPVQKAIIPLRALCPRFIRLQHKEGKELNQSKKLSPAPIKYNIKLAVNT